MFFLVLRRPSPKVIFIEFQLFKVNYPIKIYEQPPITFVLKELVSEISFYPIKGKCFHHKETGQLIYSANQLTVFYKMGT